MNRPLYVVMERIDNEWVPAIGGGSSTSASIRAFGNLTSAKKSMKGLNRFRGYQLQKVKTQRRIAKFIEVED